MSDFQLRKWRLILGADAAETTGVALSTEEQRMDGALEAVYDPDRKGGLGASSPKVSRWLGDIREFFPQRVVQVMQRDAIERLNLTQLLLEKEMLENVEPDVNLVATLMSLGRMIPDKTRDTARQVVRKVVDVLLEKLTQPTQQAISGALAKSVRKLRPRHNEINWSLTIRRNLQHYQPEY